MKLPAVLLLWVAAVYRIWVLRRSSNFITITYAAAAASIAAAFTIAAAEQPVDDFTAPYISDLLEHALAVTGGVAANLFLLGLKSGRPRRRDTARRLILGGLVVVAMIGTFAAAPIHQQAHGDLDVSYGNVDTVIAYRLIFNAYLTYILIDNVRLCRRYAAIPGDIGRSVSLRLVGWGSFICIGYSLSRILYVLVDVAANRRIPAIRTAGSVCAATGLSALALGMLAPWAARRLHDWHTALSGLRRLRPLWCDVTALWPDLVLATLAPATPRRAELRFDRWLVETSEGLARAGIQLHAHCPAEMQAALIRSALEGRPTPFPVAEPDGRPLTSRDEEREILLAVARAYATRSAERDVQSQAAA